MLKKNSHYVENVSSILGDKKTFFVCELNKKLGSFFGCRKVQTIHANCQSSYALSQSNLQAASKLALVNRTFATIKENLIKKAIVTLGENTTEESILLFEQLKPQLVALTENIDDLQELNHVLYIIKESLFDADGMTNNLYGVNGLCLLQRCFHFNINKLANYYLSEVMNNNITKKGMCFGLSSTFINAVLANDLATFIKRLQVLANKDKYLFFMGKYYDSLPAAIDAAYKKYKEYVCNSDVYKINNGQNYEHFKTFCPDAFFLMELRVWFENLFTSQKAYLSAFKDIFPCQKLVKQFLYMGSKALEQLQPGHEGINSSGVYATEDWSLPLHKQQLKSFLHNLPNAVYYITMGYHCFAVYIQDHQLILCDQNNLQFILVINKNELDESNINAIFKSFAMNDASKDAVTFSITALTTVAKEIDNLNTTLKEMSFAARKTVIEQYQLQEINIISKNHQCQLLLAVQRANLVAVSDLLTYKQHQDALLHDHGLLIFIAARHGYGDIINLLIKYGAQRVFYEEQTNTLNELISVNAEVIQLKVNDNIEKIPNTNANIYH